MAREKSCFITLTHFRRSEQIIIQSHDSVRNCIYLLFSSCWTKNNGEIRRPQKLRQHKKSPVTNCSNKKRANTKSPFWRIYRLELLIRPTEPHVCCKKPFYVLTEFMSKEKSSNIIALTKVRWYTLSSNEKVAISQFFIYEFLLGAFIIATVPSWQYWRDSPQW